MKIVADAGPLMAFAKLDALTLFFQIFPHVLTAPSVFDEVVNAGIQIGAPDAVLLKAAYEQNKLEARRPLPGAPPLAAALGRGEEESIRLAISEKASWLLVDDAEARRLASLHFEAVGTPTQIKGTLGVLVGACRDGLITREQAVGLVETIEKRSDIWVRASLCRSVVATLRSEQ